MVHPTSASLNSLADVLRQTEPLYAECREILASSDYDRHLRKSTENKEITSTKRSADATSRPLILAVSPSESASSDPESPLSTLASLAEEHSSKFSSNKQPNCQGPIGLVGRGSRARASATGSEKTPDLSSVTLMSLADVSRGFNQNGPVQSITSPPTRPADRQVCPSEVPRRSAADDPTQKPFSVPKRSMAKYDCTQTSGACQFGKPRQRTVSANGH